MLLLYRPQSRCRSRGAAVASGSSAARQSILPEPFFTPTVEFCVAVCVAVCVPAGVAGVVELAELAGTVPYWA